jgi:hypothetical protein
MHFLNRDPQTLTLSMAPASDTATASTLSLQLFRRTLSLFH